MAPSVLRPLNRAVAAIACFFGLHHLARRRHRRELLILCYHGVTDAPATWRGWWQLAPRDQFERQLRYLMRHYRIMPIDGALAELRAGGLRAPTACVTFDDGYLNNRTVALPVLQRLGVPATVYLATGLIGTPRRLWTTRLEWKFMNSPRTRVDLSGCGLPVPSPALNGAAGRRRLARAVIDRLKRAPPAARAQAVAMLADQLGGGEPVDDAAFGMMDWSDARAMEQTGLISFGGHTVHHEIVSRLDDDQQEREIGGCLATLRERLTAPSGTFAYPNGQPQDFDERSIRALRRAGASAAVSTIEGLTDAQTDPYALRRIMVGGDLSYSQFRALTSGLVGDLKRLLRFGHRDAEATVADR